MRFLPVLAILFAAPALAATFTVSKTADTNDGVCNADCSLREAIVASNNAAGADSIHFAVAGTFTPATPLPTITGAVTIAGSTAPGYGSSPVVRIDGINAGPTATGLTVNTTGTTIDAVAVTRFGVDGISLVLGSNTVRRSYLGLALDGVTDAGNGRYGIQVFGPNNVIGTWLTGNRISGNGDAGIAVWAGANNTSIVSNMIGTDAAGLAAVPNDGAGITGAGGSAVTVGGNLNGSGNVISGNLGGGVSLTGTSSGWWFAGNNIGADATGAASLGNVGTGMFVTTPNHTIGGTSSAHRNTISGNGTGIYLSDTASDVAISGNAIGTNAAGTATLSGQTVGIRSFAPGLTVGGATTSHRNIIGGNTNQGISFEPPASAGYIRANHIGVGTNGLTPLPNGTGISLGGTEHTVGGSVLAERNVISGNADYGLLIYGSAHAVAGNAVGTDVLGNTAIANGTGMRLLTATSVAIGGTSSAEGNFISGNLGDGITFDADSSNCLIVGNTIGTNAEGSEALANGTAGITLNGTNHTVGGTSASARNVISGNQTLGVAVFGTGHSIFGNRIGTDAGGTLPVPNSGGGIRILSASSIGIGSAAAGAGNVISANGNHGIALDSDSSACTIAGNLIGTNASGTSALPNTGMGLAVAGVGHQIGGPSSTQRNVVSGNLEGGLLLLGADHLLRGNYIGTNTTGTSALPNGLYGVRAIGLTGATIGGSAPGEGNVIAGNPRGVSLEAGSTGNLIAGNVVGLNASATADLPDQGSGIEILDAPNNAIGTPGGGNIIAGFAFHGVMLQGAASIGTSIRANWIGTNPAGDNGLGNHLAGIFVAGALDSTIGGVLAGEGNTIANNGFTGVRVERGEGHRISGNSVYGNAQLGIDVGAQGIEANDGGDGDAGGNRGQNYPLLATALSNGGTIDIQGALFNEPSTTYDIEVFSSSSCDATGFGEGRHYVGSAQATTDPTGHASLDISLPFALNETFVSATVSDPTGNTSEFSPCAAVGAGQPNHLQFFDPFALGYEGVFPTAPVVVTRSHGLLGTVSVDLILTDGSAVVGQDYLGADTTLVFQPWEVVKVVDVPILFDPATEPDPETVDLALSNPSAGAALGLAAADLLIFDYDASYPGVTITDAAAVEGDDGSKTLTFHVHVTNSNHSLTIAYATEDGTALAGEDYEATSGEVTFPAGTNDASIDVVVFGDTIDEGEEHFALRLLNVPGGGTWIAYDSYGDGAIYNDDAPPEAPLPSWIFADGFESGSALLWSAVMP